MFSSVDLKREADLCSACLSSERSLYPLTADTQLYATLLGTAHHTDQNSCRSRYSVSLCWECRALLRRVRQFRLQIQRAHQILTHAEPTLHSHFNSLSCLTKTHQVYNFNEHPCNVNEKFQIFCGPNEKAKPRETYNEDYFKYNLEAENIFVESLPVNETVQDGVKVEVSAASEDLYGSDHTYETHLDLQAALKGNRRKGPHIRKKVVKKINKVGKKQKVLATDKHTVKHDRKIKPTENDLSTRSKEKKVKRTFPETVDDETFESFCSHDEEYDIDCIGARTTEKPHQCEVCSKAFSLKGTLTIHMRLHTGEKPFQCELCTMAFSRKDSLRKHRRTHTGEKPFPCKVCPKAFSARGNLRRHMLSHNGEKSFQCEVCSKLYSRKEYLLNHIRTHNDENEHVQCSKSSNQDHVKGEKPAECEICLKIFSDKQEFSQHKKSHTREEPVQCEVCTKTFSGKRGLYQHKKAHTDKKPFQCNLCSRAFLYKAPLLTHIRTHTGEKPFQCEVCLKAFAQQVALNRHMRLHTGEKPYQCEVCSKKHSQKAHLLSHMRTHTGQKQFQCSLCQKSFTSKQTMVIHIRNHTGDKPFQCESCPKAFPQKRQLMVHKRTHGGKLIHYDQT